MKATRLSEATGMRGEAYLYKLDPPLQGNEFVVVSAVKDSWVHETYIFPSNEEGEVIDWGELDGSQQGTTSHSVVLCGLGYTLVS